MADVRDRGWIVPVVRAPRARAFPWGVIGVSVLVLVLTWPEVGLVPQPGLDPSWMASLHMAAHSDLAWGRDLIFTYGPLGFLTVPKYYYSDTGALALIYRFVTEAAVIGLVFVGLRRRLGPWWAFAFVFLSAALIEDETAPLIAFACAIAYVQANPRPRWAGGLVFPILIGLFGGAELLVKTNFGATVVVIGAIALLAAGARRAQLRALAALAGGVVVGVLAGWVVTGQPLSALPDWVHNSARIIAGYSSTMQIEDPTLRWQYTAALVLVVVGVAVCMMSGEARSALIAVMFLVLAFFMFKEGFVRHDAGHASLFFTTMMFAFALLPWNGPPRPSAVPILALVYTIVLAATFHGLKDVVRPISAVKASWDDMSTLVRPGDRRAIEREGAQAVLAAQALDGRTVALIRRGTVAIWPVENDIAWALSLKWKPLPVLQNYSAYTPGLDAVDAARLSSPDGPTRVLVGNGPAVDGRITAFDTPLAARALLCHYRVEHVQSPTWVVVVRGRNRCGPKRLIGSVRAGWGQSVTVPAPPGPRDIVLASVAGVQVTGLEKIRSTLYKAHERTVVLNDDPANVHRLAPATAGDGMLVRAAPGVDYPAPLSLAPGAMALTFGREGAPTSGMPLRVDFYAVRVGR